MSLLLRDRLVVTGIGVISPLGSDLDSFWQGISASTPPRHEGRANFTGQINDFGPVTPATKKLIRKSLKLMNRETQLGVAAAQKAIQGSGILAARYDADRIGVCFGAGNVEIRREDFAAGVDACRQAAGQFDLAMWGHLGISHVDPLWILRVLPNMPACHTAIVNDFRGPNNTITQCGVATNMAINEARMAILDGDADAMIVGGTGTRLVSQAAAEDQRSVQPAEAAAAFVLERMDAAIDRGADLFGEILTACSATMIHRDHRADPRSAIRNVVADALAQAAVRPDSIAHISSDRTEFDFDVVNQSLADKPVISLTQRTGDAEAGSSALAVAASLLSTRYEQLPVAGGTLDPDDNTTAVNVSVMENGLSSCVVIGKVFQRVAA